MFRFAGILVGSGAAIALILMVLGVPELPDGEQTVPVEIPQPLDVILDPAPKPEPEPVAEPVVAAPPEPAPPSPEPAPEPLPVRWHAFWSPFGSRIAADGFVRRLEAVTGFDYRVVKIDNGVFEVAFAYTSDAERDSMLTAIAAATGLELPDS